MEGLAMVQRLVKVRRWESKWWRGGGERPE